VAGSFGIWLAAWAGAALLVVGAYWRQRSCGLIAAYIGALALYYWIAAILYVLPWYHPVNDPGMVKLGLEESTYAVIAFAIGALFVSRVVVRHRSLEEAIAVPSPDQPAVTLRLALMYGSIGIVSYVAVNTVLHNVPTFTAFAAVGSQLVVVGACVGCWQAWRQGRRRQLAFWLPIAAVLPMVTIIVQGFLGFGAIAALIIVAFLLHQSRPGWRPVIIGLLVSYLALSLFATYFGSRSAIREVVWSGSGYAARITEVRSVFESFHWFSLTNHEDLAFIDGRLNQDAFVGASVELLSGTNSYAHGQTIQQAVEALVPRILWPSKPAVAGSGDLVAIYTGLRFPAGTAEGIGTVMELYINFGTVGVVIGFLILGVLLGIMDERATRHLRNSDVPRFALWFLVGISFLDVVGGSLVELTTSAGASLILALVINRLLPRSSPMPELVPSALDRVRGEER
jgi:hypothetical protein